MPKSEQRLSHDEAEEEAFEIQKNLEKNQQPSEEGGFNKEQYQAEAEKIQGGQEENLEIQLTPEQQAAKKRIINELVYGNINTPKDLKEEFNIPEEIFQQAVTKGMIERLSWSNIDRAKEIKEKFNVPEEVVLQAAKEGIIKELSSNTIDIDRVKEIKEEFNVPEEVVLQAAKEAIINHFSNSTVSIDCVKEIKEEFNVPEEVVLQVTKEAIIKLLSEGCINDAERIKERFNVPEEVVLQVTKEAMIKHLSRGDINNALRIKGKFNIVKFNIPENIIKEAIERAGIKHSYPFFLGCDMEPDYKNEMWQKMSEEIKKDEFMADKFALAGSLWGQKQWENIIKENAGFWSNAHDNLLFLEKVSSKENQQELFELVLRPIVSRDFSDFSRLNELLGYFDIGKYREKSAGRLVPFTNFEAFAREAEMQRYNIEIPPDASDEFKEAIRHLISVKGVDIPFLRKMIDDYKQQFDITKTKIETTEEPADFETEDEENYEEEGSTNFSNRLINIIEGVEPINENKEIKPWSETFSLDPVNRLVFTAVGIHSLNNLTVKMQEYFNPDGGLAGLVEVLSSANKEIVQRIEQEYEEKIKANPAKKNRLKAERDRQIKKEQLLVYGGNQEVIGISDFNESAWQMALNTDAEKLNGELSTALAEPGLRELIYSSLSDLSKKREIIDNCVDLIPFRNALAESFDKLSEKFDKEKFKTASAEEIMEFFGGEEAAFSAYLLYLGINNRQRQTESKKFKTGIDQIINQEKYKKQLQQLKTKGLLEQKADIFVAYTQGKIVLEKNDDERVREALKTFGYANVGRSLKAEIAAGDDYTAWTCGDETDCCMPFTSHKNQEYLLRNDTAYFVVKIADQAGNEEIIAQSVLVHAENPEDKKEEVIAIDNIEIANRAINLRPAVKEAYDKLKDELVSRFPKKKLRLIIGTSYNDDGGVITGDLPLVPVGAIPHEGDLGYSDCFSHSSAYEFYNSRENKSLIKYFGLAKDLLERSKIYDLVKDKKEMEEIEKLMGKIGQGEDDGDGGLNFPDNYSTVIVDIKAGNQAIGYIVAADYLTDDKNENDYVCLEKVGWKKDIASQEAKNYFKNYLESRDLIAGQSHEDLDGLKISQEFIASRTELMSWLEEFYGKDRIVQSPGGEVVVNWSEKA